MNGRRENRPGLDEAIRYGAAIDTGLMQAGKAYKYAQIAAAGYKLGRKFVNSFSQNEKMPAVKRRLSYSSPKASKRRRLADMSPVVTPLRYKKSPAKSPGFMRKSGKRKSMRTAGASSSKSKGFVSKPRSRQGWMDYYSKGGIVFTREQGGNIVSTTEAPLQTVNLLQTTYGCDQILRDVSYALVKMVLLKLKVDIENVNDSINWGTRVLNFVWLGKDFVTSTAVALLNVDYVEGTTMKIVADALFTALKTKLQFYSEYQLTHLIVTYQAVATTPVVPKGQILTLDLHHCTIQGKCKSALKMQNRTINSTGNDQADDVDNVPLYGRTYDGTGNYLQIEESYYFPNLTNEWNVAHFGGTANSTLAEPPQLSVVQRAKRSGKLHLDPAEIKTSVLEAGYKLNLNQLFKIISRGDNSNTQNILNIGKFRMFSLEKMLQAVGTTTVNGIQLFYEADLKSGCIATCPQKIPTTMTVRIDPI